MIPSDLVLKSVPLAGYNNNLLIASNNMKIGHNDSLNTDSLTISIQDAPKVFTPPVSLTCRVAISPVYLSIGISLMVLAVFYICKIK